jgi:acetoin:2,6-dichlorophenolindophenol oxidoreductase subunit alpha
MDKQEDLTFVEMVEMLHIMLRIRLFEYAVAELYKHREIRCPVHLCVGEEAIATGVCAALRVEDHVYSTHRSHGHFIAKGGSLKRLMAELYGKNAGASSGFGGSMHVVERSTGFMGSSAIVGGTIPIAVGDALAARTLENGRISVTFFGDGATDEGVFYESINLAMLYRLPVLFVCENNGFSTHMPDFLRQSNPAITQRIAGFKLPAHTLDGNNSLEVQRTAREAADRARSGGGPSLLECSTYRWLAHVGPDTDEDVGYRTKTDIEYWTKRCPIEHLRKHLLKSGYAPDSYNQLYSSVQLEVEEAIRYARDAKYPLEVPA